MSKLISYCARQKSINRQAAVQTRRGFATPSKSLKRTKYSRFVTVPLLLAGTSDVLLAQWMHANPDHMQWLQKQADTNQLAGFVVDNINLVNGGIDQLKGALRGLQESVSGSGGSGSSASPVSTKHSEVASPKTILSRLPKAPLSAPNSEVLKKEAAAKKEQEEIDQKELDLQKKKLAEKQLVLQKEAEERALLDKETQQKEVMKTKERHKEGFMKELTSMVHMLKSTSEQAIAAHQEAIDAIRDHSSQLKQALDSTGETDGVEGVWAGVIAASEAAAVAVEAAEKLQLITLESVETVQRKVLEGKSDTEVKKLEDLKSADSLAKTLKQDLSQAVTRFEKAQTDFSMVREYRNMIKEAREQFKKELESLNPELKMGQKFGGKLSEEELGMLVGHAHTRIQQLQNQLAEAKALDKLRIERAMLEQKGEDRKVTDALVQREHNSMLSELEQEKQKWIEESHKMFEELLAKELARQENGHIEHIRSSLKSQESTLSNKFSVELKDRLLEQHERFQAEVAASVSRIRGIENAVNARAELEKQGRRAQELWLACQTLSTSIDQGQPDTSGMRKPLLADLKSIRDVSSDHPFISAVTASFRPESVHSGVCTESSLYDRFQKVYRVARKVALIDETGGSLYQYAMSYMCNWMVMPFGEVLKEDSVIDGDVTQFMLLDSAKHYLSHGDFELAIRFVNQLKGESRRVANDWLNEARLTLEAKQAAKCLMAHSAASGLSAIF